MPPDPDHFDHPKKKDRGSIDYHGRKFGFHEGHYGQTLICPYILPDSKFKKYRAMEKMGLFFFSIYRTMPKVPSPRPQSYKVLSTLLRIGIVGKYIYNLCGLLRAYSEATEAFENRDIASLKRLPFLIPDRCYLCLLTGLAWRAPEIREDLLNCFVLGLLHNYVPLPLLLILSWDLLLGRN